MPDERKAIVQRITGIQTQAEEIKMIVTGLAGPPDVPVEPLPGPAPIPPEDAPDVPPNDQESYLIIGKAEGAPGDSVEVEILCRTPHEIGGFGITFGVDAHVRLTGHTITDEVKALFPHPPGVEFVPMDIVSQGRGQTVQTQFVAAFLGFFSKVTEADVGTDLSGKRGPFAVAIPNMTPLMRLFFKIPDDAPPGKRYVLDNRSFYYGREMKSPRQGSMILRQNTVLTTLRDSDFRHGIHPILVSGWIDVTASDG